MVAALSPAAPAAATNFLPVIGKTSIAAFPSAVAGGSMVLASAPGLLSTSLRHNVIFLTVLVASLIYGLRETGRRALDRRSIRPRRRHVGLWRAAAPNRYASDRNSLFVKGGARTPNGKAHRLTPRP